MGEHEPGSAAAWKLTRRARRRRDADAHPDSTEPERAALSEDDALNDRTVVIDRGDANERTVVIDRGDANERTVVIDRGDANERTVVIDRSRASRSSSHAEPEASDRDPSIADTVIVRYRDAATGPDPSVADTIAAPPRRSLPEPTPAIYKPRPAPIVPSRPPAITGGAAPTRDTAVVKTSVARRDRRAGVVAVVSVAVACLVSVVGLAALVITLLS